MKEFNNLIAEVVLKNLYPFEDYSNKICKIKNVNESGKCFKYVDCMNNCIISEDSLSRTLSVMKEKEFAILTAYRNNFSKVENILRNRKLRAELNTLKMGVHQLVGHWQEAPAGKVYSDCLPNELTDVVERSYLVAKPEYMSSEEFEKLILRLLTIDGETQDAAIIKNDEGIFLLFNNGMKEQLGTNISIGEINQAYSQHVKKLNVPFVFEGIEIPSSNLSKQMYTKHNILY